jgi:hypothetical membrane protein
MNVRFTVWSLRAGVLVPILYFGTLIGSSLTYPGYNHARQYASELGSSSAPYPQLFNAGIILTALAVLASLPGFRAVLRALNANTAAGWLFLITLGAFGIGTLMGGLFPMPDPRHTGFGLGFAVHLAPALLAFALWRTPASQRLKVFLIATCVASLVMFAIMMGVGSLVRRANVGVFQRIYALTIIPWIGISAYALRRVQVSRRENHGLVDA